MAQYSLDRYLKEYHTNASYLLSNGWKGGKQDRSVFATWEISFNAIQNNNPNAAKLLLICGFLNNEDICEELLKRGMKLKTPGMGFFNNILSYVIYIFYQFLQFNSMNLLGQVLITWLMYCYRSRGINQNIIFILPSKAK